MYMFDWLTGNSAKQNRQNVKDLAKHLNTLKRGRKSSSSSSSSSTFSSPKRKSKRRKSLSSSSSRKSKGRTRKLEAQMEEYNKILAGLPRHSAVKLMIQQELQAKAQTESDILGKLTAMTDSLKAQKDATDAQMEALKLEIKVKKEQGESVEKETKELKAVMVDQVKTDATISRIEKYGGLVANGLNTTGNMAANVGAALKGATYGVGDVTKSFGANALGAAYGLGNAGKALGSTALGAAYGLGNATKALGTTALGAAYGLGNAAKDVHKNKDVVGYYANGAKFAAKTGYLGPAAFVVGHTIDVKQLATDVNSAINSDIVHTMTALAKKAPSVKEFSAIAGETVTAANDQINTTKKNTSNKNAHTVTVQLKNVATQAKAAVKEVKASGSLPVSAPSDDARILKLISEFKNTDPFSEFLKISTGRTLRSPALQAKIKALGSKYMHHLAAEILKLENEIRTAVVHPTQIERYHSEMESALKEEPGEKQKDMKGMKVRAVKVGKLTEIVRSLHLYSVPLGQAPLSAPQPPLSQALTPDAMAVDAPAFEAAAAVEEAVATARASTHSPVAEIRAADAAGAALEALQAADLTTGAAAAEARAAAEAGVDAAAEVAAAGAAAAETRAEKKQKSAKRALKQLQGTAGFVAETKKKRQSVKFL